MMYPFSQYDIDRFWMKVDKDGPIPEACPGLGQCWLWTSTANKDGYGRFKIFPSLESAHRVAWVIDNGPISSKKLNVLHRCDTPKCVRQAHLFLGTRVQNMQDMLTKKRGNKAVGERNRHAKLTEEEVQEIRMLASTLPINALAGMFSVHRGTIARIILKKTWKHI